MLLGSVKSSQHNQRLSREEEKRKPLRNGAQKIPLDLTLKREELTFPMTPFGYQKPISS